VTDRPLVGVMGAPDRGLPSFADAERIATLEHAAEPSSIEPIVHEVEVIFAWGGRRAELLDLVPRATKLRWIQTSSAGVEDLSSSILPEHDVVLTNAAGVFDAAMAESVLGFLLAFSGRLLEDARAEPGSWPHDPIRRLAGTVALVVGAGSIGTETGRLLRSGGLRVRGIARTARPADRVFEAIAGPESLEEELAGADHVVNVLPITPATPGFFGASVFEAMKPGAIFVNIGRGATVDEPALIRALADGRIGGAALDVFEREPLPADSPLWRMPNVLVSPHRAGDHEGWERDVVSVFVDNLRRFVAGEPLRNVVDVELGYAPGERSSSFTPEARAAVRPPG
jgi:phosphoglycerate dehydrogenase-like enzyme